MFCLGPVGVSCSIPFPALVGQGRSVCQERGLGRLFKVRRKLLVAVLAADDGVSVARCAAKFSRFRSPAVRSQVRPP